MTTQWRSVSGWRVLLEVFVMLAGAVGAFAQAKPGELTIYLPDMDGAGAAVYISPTGETLVYDTGGGQGASRILDALKDAGSKEIDYIVTSHYDGDHTGGVKEISDKYPVHNFVDYGKRITPVSANARGPDFQAVYPSIYAKGKHTVAQPGDKLALKGMDVTVITSRGEAITKPLPGAGKPNPGCAGFQDSPDEPDENYYAVGLVFTVGKFRTINNADLLWNMEKKFMCPNNLVGTVDLYVASHHGLSRSGSPAMVHALHPLVAVVPNGFAKGGTPRTYTTLETSPGLEDIWANHWAAEGGIEFNPPGRFIANLETPEVIADTILHPVGPQYWGGHPPGVTPPQVSRLAAPKHDVAYWIKITAKPSGEFTVTNSRNGFSKTYQKGN
jgi:beta-lactamase superfamily II metal-dependent hydrolase